MGIYMACYKIVGGGALKGELTIPPSKSQTMRALLFAMMGKGLSTVQSPLLSPDTDKACMAISSLGASVEKDENTIYIHGKGGKFSAAQKIDVGNSGILLRFLSALSSLSPHPMTITGDHSIKTNRPIRPLLNALQALGVSITRFTAPIAFKGPMQPGQISIQGEDSQPISALLIATSFLDKPTTISVTDPGETPWIDLTLHWLQKLGANIAHERYAKYEVSGGLVYNGFTYTVPGDFSTSAFPIVAALLTKGMVKIHNLVPHDPQGDKRLLSLLQSMGGNFFWQNSTLLVKGGKDLFGKSIDINPIIDTLPILAVCGCYAKTPTSLYNGAVARTKETDRLSAIDEELTKMGAVIKQRRDGLTIFPSKLRGAPLSAHGDHRIALALAVAAFAAQGTSVITGIECVAKTYPDFVKHMQALGMNIKEIP